jgi:LysR family glycine cleavage system transcriptional activator
MLGGQDVRFPSIDGLRAFEAAARLGSFERAAEELAVTASAISKRVATLEELLSTVLLARGLRGVTPTAAGKEYLEQVRAALTLLAAVPLHQRQAQRVQRLCVSSPPTFARQVLVPLLDDFAREFPGVELEVVLSIPFLDGVVSDADVDIRNGDLGGPGVLRLMDDVVLPVAAPALLDRLPALRLPADLAGVPLLRTPLEPWTPWWQAAGLPWREPTTGPRLVDLGMTLEAAVCGQGVALARPSLAHGWLRSGALRPLFGLTARPQNHYYAVSNTARPLGPAFVQWLAQRAQAGAQRALEQLSGLG